MTITPKILTPEQLPSFEIILDTHSVDLAFDMANAAKLEDSNKILYGQATWDGDPPGGHHRTGILTFSQYFKEPVDVVTLTFSDIADEDWEFRFEL